MREGFAAEAAMAARVTEVGSGLCMSRPVGAEGSPTAVEVGQAVAVAAVGAMAAAEVAVTAGEDTGKAMRPELPITRQERRRHLSYEKQDG
jgi:hypothetical protein